MQRNLAPDREQSGIAGRLVERLAERAVALPSGCGMTEGVLLGPLVSKPRSTTKSSATWRSAASKRLSSHGGGRPKGFDRGYFVEPTIFLGVPPEARILA